MARGRYLATPPPPPPTPSPRRGLLATLVGDATAIVQSVANEVVPGVVSVIDVQAIIERVDLNEVLERVDVEAIIERVDLNEVLARVDLDPVIDRVDIGRLLAGMDLNAIVMLVNALLTQVDINAVVNRLDLDQVLERVDVNAIVERVDIGGLIERTELGPIIANAGSGVATEAIDAVRSVSVGVDSFVHRWADRVLGRGGHVSPAGPPLLVGALGEAAS